MIMLGIKGKTIHVKKPIVLADNTIERRPAIKNGEFENLISKEAILRNLAYKNTSIKIDSAFFNDSDMQSDYFLIIIYDEKSNTPLLTARYYFDKSLIAKYLKGEDNSIFDCTLNLNDYKEGEIFLADRFSGNVSSSIYRQYRDYIFELFYSEILTYNKNCALILMARKEKHEKLLNKYLSLGFHIVGSTKHKGKEHWIILIDLKKA